MVWVRNAPEMSPHVVQSKALIQDPSSRWVTHTSTRLTYPSRKKKLNRMDDLTNIPKPTKTCCKSNTLNKQLLEYVGVELTGFKMMCCSKKKLTFTLEPPKEHHYKVNPKPWFLFDAIEPLVFCVQNKPEDFVTLKTGRGPPCTNPLPMTYSLKWSTRRLLKCDIHRDMSKSDLRQRLKNALSNWP